ncbi:MAG: hypothetical protein HN826_12405 [Methylococcales bacterium]|jgi:putative DNA primase/helicase|nr:hypothetical protein [Methylococcales bacterium]
MKISEIKIIANGRWNKIIGDLAPQLSDAMAKKGRHVECPCHGGKDGFRVFEDFENTGGGVCNTCGFFNDGFNLLSWANGWNMGDTINSIKSYLGIGESGNYKNLPIITQKKEVTIDDSETLDISGVRTLKDIWENSLPLNEYQANTAWKYLAGRGLKPLYSKSIRLAHNVPYYENINGLWKVTSRQKAMIAPVWNKYGKIAALHRTFLSNDGGKANVKTVKKLTKKVRSLSGGHIRLFNPFEDTGEHIDLALFETDRKEYRYSETIGIAEGIETAMAVKELTSMATWSSISSSYMPKILIPDGIKNVFIFGDNDLSGAGERAALKTKENILQESNGEINVTIYIPKDVGKDWLDYLGKYR